MSIFFYIYLVTIILEKCMLQLNVIISFLVNSRILAAIIPYGYVSHSVLVLHICCCCCKSVMQFICNSSPKHSAEYFLFKTDIFIICCVVSCKMQLVRY